MYDGHRRIEGIRSLLVAKLQILKLDLFTILS